MLIEGMVDITPIQLYALHVILWALTLHGILKFILVLYRREIPIGLFIQAKCLNQMINYLFLYPDTGNNGNYNLVNTGHIGNYSFSICNTTSFLSLANDQISYKIKPTNYYRISGWMKGSGINGDSCSMGLGFQRLNNYSEFVPFTKQ